MSFPDPKRPRLETSTTVLENEKHPPQLCLSGVKLSLPPQCGGPNVVGWDWSHVEDEERASGTIWGDYHVVGTFDGMVFTLTERPSPAQPPVPYEPPSAPCPPPSGGWLSTPGLSDAAYSRVTQAVSKEPDFAGIFRSYQETPRKAIINVAFTGDLGEHEAEIRRIWKGNLCLFKRARTFHDFDRIAPEVLKYAEELGLTWYSYSFADVVSDALVEVSFYYADARHQKLFDDRFGKGVVQFQSALKPVD